MNYNKNKIVIFDWGGIIESHRKGEYNIDVAVENLIKHFNSKENKNIVERYYNRSIDFGINDIRDIKEDKWFEQISINIANYKSLKNDYDNMPFLKRIYAAKFVPQGHFFPTLRCGQGAYRRAKCALHAKLNYVQLNVLHTLKRRI